MSEYILSIDAGTTSSRAIIFDKKGINAIEWGAYGVPESFLIKDGIIIKRYIGPLNQKLLSEINQLIK